MRSTLVVALVLCGCGGEATVFEDGPSPDAAAPWFVEESAARGLDFSWRSGHEGRHLFPEIMGGGAAFLDAEEDGDLDLYLVQGGHLATDSGEEPPNRLFLNRGDGTFEDRTEGSGAGDRGYGMGVAAGDFDEDGATDLYVTNVGANVLLRNAGGGRFEDVSAAASVADPSWSVSAAFFDYDRDGDLDLYVANYIFWSVQDELTCYTKPHPEDYCSPLSYNAPAPDALFANRGDGTFENVAAAAGLRAVYGNGLGLVCSDFDGDGYPDVFVANDGMMNQLWHNVGDGTFRDVAFEVGCAVDQDGRQKAGMGTAAADIDGDGDEDLMVVNLGGEPDSFFRNDGGRFSDKTPLFGLAFASRSFTRFGMGFVDFDNDGQLDLYQANGRVNRSPERFGPRPFAEENLLFRGLASNRFEEVLPRGGVAPTLVGTSRAAAFGDVDGDGGVDVVVVNRDGPLYLLRNQAPRGSWISLRVLEASGRDALGAKVEARLGERSVHRTVRSAFSYCAANDPKVHLGLGAADELDEVVVTWADGVREAFGPQVAGQVVVLRRGTGDPR